ncbi:MAG TPA: HIT domain-containing protein [Proteobacteria bacterium]|nr:HIT domain-containing protein [Pseudomonadota bacterium]
MSRFALWAPWRINYILDDTPKQKEKEKECLFCRLHQEDQDRTNLVLARSRQSYVLLNRYPYSSCHLLVLPMTHVADLNDLQAESYTDLMLLLKKSTGFLQQALNPAGLNIGLNLGKAAGAGIEDHLHFHIVPRWHGDHNFMPVIADTMVMPQYLDDSYTKLKPFFTTV